jgi:hypothetical protein
VATVLTREELRRLARLGAQRRLEELRQEEAAIRAAFPELLDVGAGAGRRRGRPPGSTSAASSADGQARRQRRKMTRAQKRAVSERMKKYWAERRKAR